jgi:hypothetical protein
MSEFRQFALTHLSGRNLKLFRNLWEILHFKLNSRLQGLFKPYCYPDFIAVIKTKFNFVNPFWLHVKTTITQFAILFFLICCALFSKAQ